jgi:hypothetical protein
VKSVSQLTDFYYQELPPSLKKLERTRQELASRLKLYGFMGLVLFAIIILWISKNFGLTHIFSILTLIGSLALANLIYRSMTKEYAVDFKTKIIAPLIKAIDPHLEYNPDFMISQHLFERSKLFTQSIDRYSGNDYVKGSIDGVPLEFSDIHAENRTKNQKGKNEWRTLFRGLFLVAEFNKHFKSTTIVLPDLAEKTFGNLIGGWLQSMNTVRDPVIQLDDPEFEKKFVVYGNDPIEARYILTHSMMKRIVDFQKKITHPLFVSFRHNHIHVAIATGKDLFEPAIFTSLLDYKQAMEYIHILHSTIGLVTELKLGERLWSKV